MSNVRLPERFIDAKELLLNTLESTNSVSFKSYGSLFSNRCAVTHYHVDEVEDEEGFSNLDMTLVYTEPVLADNPVFQTVEKTAKLRVLSPAGDNDWTYRMIDKIWEGDYPSTVAVDLWTKRVYFLNIRLSGLELVEFGTMEDNQFEAFDEGVADKDPFRITIGEKAMFDYIDGSEGINNLKRNIIIEFNCGIPLKVKTSRRVGVI